MSASLAVASVEFAISVSTAVGAKLPSGHSATNKFSGAAYSVLASPSLEAFARLGLAPGLVAQA